MSDSAHPVECPNCASRITVAESHACIVRYATIEERRAGRAWCRGCGRLLDPPALDRCPGPCLPALAKPTGITFGDDRWSRPGRLRRRLRRFLGRARDLSA